MKFMHAINYFANALLMSNIMVLNAVIIEVYIIKYHSYDVLNQYLNIFDIIYLYQ